MHPPLADAARDEASGLAFERFRDALEGRTRGYPRGAIFVPSDAPHTRKTNRSRGETRDEGGWVSGVRSRLVSLRGLLQ